MPGNWPVWRRFSDLTAANPREAIRLPAGVNVAGRFERLQIDRHDGIVGRAGNMRPGVIRLHLNSRRAASDLRAFHFVARPGERLGNAGGDRRPADSGRLAAWRGTRGNARGFDPCRALPYTEDTAMYILTLIVHVIVCIFLIIVVLLQSGKAADLAGAFGGMGSQTAFGPRGSATLLSKATTISAVLFMVTSMSLSILATRNAGLGTTVLEDTQQKKAPAQTVPAAPQGQAPITVTPNGGGKPIQLTIPQPSGGASAPVKQAPVKK
jgi:preprotein translocase subunit SecG